MNKEEIKKCPFCNSSKILRGEPYQSRYRYWIGCDECPCSMYGDDLKELTKAWNTRSLIAIDEGEAEKVGRESEMCGFSWGELRFIFKCLAQHFGTKPINEGKELDEGALKQCLDETFEKTWGAKSKPTSGIKAMLLESILQRFKAPVREIRLPGKKETQLVTCNEKYVENLKIMGENNMLDQCTALLKEQGFEVE